MGLGALCPGISPSGMSRPLGVSSPPSLLQKCQWGLSHHAWLSLWSHTHGSWSFPPRLVVILWHHFSSGYALGEPQVWSRQGTETMLDNVGWACVTGGDTQPL